MNKSKTFLRQRRKSLENRLDSSWQSVTTVPVLGGGNIQYEVAGRARAIGCGGLGLLQGAVESVGLRSPAATKKTTSSSSRMAFRIEQLKSGVQATRIPVAEFCPNWAYLVIGSLAWNINAWTAMLMPTKLGVRAALLRTESRRFLAEVILGPTQIVESGRRLIYRLLAVSRRTRMLLDRSNHFRTRRYA